MSVSTFEAIQDEFVISLAQALAVANRSAREAGVKIAKSMLIIVPSRKNGRAIWEISYAPRRGVNQRGGDFIVEVDAETASVIRTLRGQ